MIHSKNKSRVLLLTILITTLVLPILPIEAKRCQIPDTIEVERINSRITRFEETIPLYVPEFGIPEGAYYRVSVYAVKVKGGIVLIDCGDDALASDLYQAVSATFGRPIKAVYLTHGHADHAGGGDYFQDQGIPVYASLQEADMIFSGAGFGALPDAFTYPGYTINGTYGNLDLFRGFHILPAPGHTPGAVHIEYNKGRSSYLFTADTILPMEEDNDPDQRDFTYTLNLMTAAQNYQMQQAGVWDFWTYQLLTLNATKLVISDYDLVLTGHAPVLDSSNSLIYVDYTIDVLETVVPFIPLP